ncbi:hypothetical protein GGF41_002759 [Coemansia sp. RSA 2531]|nr:hypothetical protein GGF41_002759 [Coemansia sp. RSA 2531]
MGSSSKRKTGKSKCLLDIPEDSSENTAVPLIVSKKGSKPSFAEDKSGSTDAKAARKTFRIEPPSDLLSRLHSFLPQIAIANKQLEVDIAEDPHKLDIENVDENEEQYIEMDLGLGVFDMKPKKDDGAEDIHINTKAEESDDMTSDGEDDGARIVIDPSSMSARSRPKPQIQVLANRDEEDGDALMDELV